MWVYSDYIEVKKDFVPVFSEEVDREHPEDWKSFIPHQGLGNILSGLTKALDRASPADKLSLWVHGAYGTGKTFACFVVKHLLEDPLEAIEEYFRRYKQLEKEWAKFKAIRERGEYLVVFRSSSAHINSTLKLLVELQQAVKAKLQQKGHAHVVGETFHEMVLDKLTNPKSAFNWKRAFENHRHEFMDFASAEDVVSKVKSGDVEMTEKIARILEKEGFVLVDSPAAVKTWLGQVIKQNRLQGIVFLWDEFTDFFVKNDQVSGLQELAQATSEMPFYLYLVTHKSLEQFQRIDAETRKKISERFHNIHFEMKPVTAYQLIAHAIESRPGK